MNEREAAAALWRQASAQFDELWDLAEDEREARLESLRQVAPDLAREVAELLAAALRAGERFDRAPAVTGSSTDPSPPEAAEDTGDANATTSGERFGSWKLVGPLGAGGMGEVWVAERADGAYTQRAALKLLKRGLDSAAILERFARERQILAGLRHPAITLLLDGGLSEDGRPFLVMELAAGQPITQACVSLGLGLEARLRKFLVVCEAVSAAHRSLVVHRDLKPSNVLLSDAGEVKLLDFGIAKLLDDSSGSEMTAPELAAMTPAYAAPEQILGAPVTTATDVYGLGAVLYELVTGARPHRRTATTPAGLVRELAAEVVHPPSEAVLAGAPADRGRRALAHRLRGDLDAILLQALASDPGKRYSSAAALADDIERFLAQRPVAASRSVPGAAAWKFLARHRIAVGVAAAVALIILVAVGEALREGVRARSEARHAERVQEFLLAMFQGADPARTMGDALTALEVVDQGARQLTRGLEKEPEARAALEEALALLYRTLGRSQTALGLATRARKEFSTAFGPAAPRTLLAHLTEIEIRSDLGELAASRTALDELLPALASAFGTESREHLRARSALGAVLAEQGEFQANLELQHDLARTARRVYGASALETAQVLESLGSAQGEVALFAEARNTLLEALAMLESLDAGASPQAVLAETTLAEVLEASGRNDEANAGYRHALERGRKVLGSNHPQVAQILVKLGLLLTNMRQLPEAGKVLHEALAIFEARNHYEAGSALRYLGQVELFDERFAEAKATFDRAELFLRDRLGPDHMLTWAAVVSSAQARMKLGELADAERMQRASIVALSRIHGEQSLEVRTPMKHLGETLRLSGRFEEAIDLHRRALAIERRLLGDDLHRPIALSKQQLALDLAAVGGRSELDEARQLAAEAVAYFRDHEPEVSRIGEALAVSGRVAAAAGEVDLARADLSQALATLTPVRRQGSPGLEEIRRHLAALPSRHP